MSQVENRLRPLLVGEANPYGEDLKYALYPLPEQAAGARLARILQLSKTSYLRAYDRENLCPMAWSMKVARENARRIDEARAGVVVLLGRKVATAFCLEKAPPYTAVGRYVILPHPSGLNRVWADPTAAVRAREVLRTSGCPVGDEAADFDLETL